MPAVGSPSLEQLRVLAAVADTGSFSEAARRLGKAQSVVSYAIGNLEAQLGVTLFDRRPRGPLLTEAGRAILGDARRISGIVEGLRARASGLQQGLEATVSLVVDVMFPTRRLVAALEAFQAAFPTVDLNLQIDAMGGIVRRVLDESSNLGVGGWIESDHLNRRQIGEVTLIPVAAPTHPLAVDPADESPRDHTQLVLTDPSGLSGTKQFGVLAARQWRLGDLGAKHALLRAGLGWGNMPEDLVRDDLKSGALVRLALPEGRGARYPIFLMTRADRTLGPAGSWLAARLEQSGCLEAEGRASAAPAEDQVIEEDHQRRAEDRHNQFGDPPAAAKTRQDGDV